MSKQTLVVYTGVNLEMLQTEGGSGYWSIADKQLANLDYFIATKNHNQPYTTDTHQYPKGCAFFIAKIAGMFTETDSHYQGKKVVTFSEYAKICVPNAWFKLTETGKLPARRYFNTQDVLRILDIDINQLNWKPFIAHPSAKPHSRRFI